MFSLTHKIALITGGGSGIGEAIAHALSDAGATLILIGRDTQKLEKALGARNGMVVAIDIVQEGAIDSIYQTLSAANMYPDIIVNAAGVNHREVAANISSASWDNTLDLNLKIPFFLCQAFIEPMKQKKWGRIINIASLQSSRAFKGGIAYGASKGGITQLTRAMAEEWSSYGITANALAPGFFPTNLTKVLFDDTAKEQQLAAQTAIGRNGALEDLKGPAVFFASNASAYVTGQTLYIDGGFTAK